MKFSKYSNFYLPIYVIICCAFALSCSNLEEEQKQKSTVVALVNSQSNLSIYKEAVEITGLNSILSTGNSTFFIPTNSAFNKFLIDNNYAVITDVPVPILKEILMNHFMNGLVLSTNLNTGYYKSEAKGTASATNNLSLYVSNLSGVITLNGISKVITSDVIASNGIIHIVDAVLSLPTILSQLTANASFSDLLAALTVQNQFLPLNYFKNKLSDATIKTFFAPTNAAFTSFNTEFGFTTANPIATNLQNQILRYHIATENNYLANSFTNNQVIATNQLVNLTIQLSSVGVENYVKLKDVNNRLATITYQNIQCTNGIIHIVDKVLKP